MEDSAWDQAERHQRERRGWHAEATAANEKANAHHGRNLRLVWMAALARPVIELAILVVLIAHWFA